MTIEELFQLYPSAIISSLPSEEKLSLWIDDTYVLINQTELSISEVKLLKHLFPLKECYATAKKHPWYAYLFEKKPLTFLGKFRFFHFHIQKPKDFFLEEWTSSIMDIFDNYLDFFFFSESEGVLVEQYTKNHFSIDDIQSIFLTLDADFDSSTMVFISQFFSSENFSPNLFHEEQAIFLEERRSKRKQETFSLPNVCLHYFTKSAISNSQLMTYWKNNSSLTDDMKKIILSLWQNQGNISSTAKDLFMHRNTLHYRIDKFSEQTGLSLKKMDDLFFCYLLLLN